MSDGEFDELARRLAQPMSRRRAFKALAGAIVGGILLKSGAGAALADEGGGHGGDHGGGNGNNNNFNNNNKGDNGGNNGDESGESSSDEDKENKGICQSRVGDPCSHSEEGRPCCDPLVCQPSHHGDEGDNSSGTCQCPSTLVPSGTSCVCPGTRKAPCKFSAAGVPLCCGTGETCVNGTCVCGSTTGTTGTACPAGSVCDNGACYPSCTGSFTPCGTTGTCFCVTDTNHTSVCVQNRACPAASECTTNADCGAGEVCVPANPNCPGSPNVCNAACGHCPTQAPTTCAGVCTNTQTDTANCGKCGMVCSTATVPNSTAVSCTGGACVATACAAGFLLCGGACVAGNTNTNCGACGNACTNGNTCQPSPTSTGGFTCQCGTTGSACPSGSMCDNGTCFNTCAAGSSNLTQPACGASGSRCVCVTDTSGNPVCVQARAACPTGTGTDQYCSSNADCPGGSVCIPNPYCTGGPGVCNAPCGSCPSGLILCNGQCVVPSSTTNCGACGNTCGAGETCQASTTAAGGFHCACGSTVATGTGPACHTGQTCVTTTGITTGGTTATNSTCATPCSSPGTCATGYSSTGCPRGFVCGTTPTGGYCLSARGSCSDQRCTTSADCPNGSVCSIGSASCCGFTSGGVCEPAA